MSCAVADILRGSTAWRLAVSRGVMALALLLPVSPVNAQTRIAVMPFRGIGVSPADAPLVDGLADMLSTNLSESKGIQVLERVQIKSAMQALKIDDSGVIDRNTAVELGKWLGATHVVVGTLVSLGQQVRMDSRVVSLSAGVIEKSARAEGTRKDLFALINTLSTRVLSGLTGEVVSFNEAKRVLLEQQFKFVVPSPPPQNMQRFVSQPMFDGVDPRLVVRFVADYFPEGPPPKPAGKETNDGLLKRLAGALTVTYAHATRVHLVVNDAVVATWAADQAQSTMETQQIISLGNIAAKLSVQTVRIGAGPVQTKTGAKINRIVDVAAKVLIERQNP